MKDWHPYEGLDRKCFLPCGLCSFFASQSACEFGKQPLDDVYARGRGCVPKKLHLQGISQNLEVVVCC